jgi:hypothetical protein
MSTTAQSVSRHSQKFIGRAGDAGFPIEKVRHLLALSNDHERGAITSFAGSASACEPCLAGVRTADPRCHCWSSALIGRGQRSRQPRGCRHQSIMRATPMLAARAPMLAPSAMAAVAPFDRP